MGKHDIATLEGRKQLKQATPQTRLDYVHTENCRVLPSRDALLQRLARDGVAAEVGAAFGDFTASILMLNKPRCLHLIDSWESSRYEEGLKKIRTRFEKEITAERLVLNRGYSTDELKKFDDAYFDWVYIDTNHSFGTTFAELELSAKKVKPDGMIAGHDFCTGNVIDPVPYGVIEACAKFCVEHGWQYRYLTLESHGHFSFCLSKI